VDEAIEMYQELHKWDDAIIVAEAKVMQCIIHFIQMHYQYAGHTCINNVRNTIQKCNDVKQKISVQVSVENFHCKSR